MIPWWWLPIVGIFCFIAGLGWRDYIDEQRTIHPPVDHSADSDNVTYPDSDYIGGDKNERTED